MDRKDYDNQMDMLNQEFTDADSGIYADEESARLELAGIFSNRFSNVTLLYRSAHGATEIQEATRYGNR